MAPKAITGLGSQSQSIESDLERFGEKVDMTSGNTMLKNNLIYMGAALMAQGISVLLVPVYTKNMSLDDFGLYNLMITVQMLLSILATVGISSALTRFFNEFEDKNQVKNVTLTFVVLLGLLVTIPVLFFSERVYSLMFGIGANGGQMIIIIMMSTLCLSITGVYNAYYNMQGQASINAVANIGKSLLLLGLSIILVIYMRMGLMGALWAQLFSYSSVAIVLLGFDFRNLKAQLRPDMLKLMLKYSCGLIPGEISTWVYSLIDRYFINALLGLASVGIYSLGFRLGSLFEPLFLQPFRSVFAAFKYKEYKNAGAREKIHEIYLTYASIAWFIAFGIATFAKPGILLLSTAEYIDAASIVPLVVTAYVLYGFNEFFGLGLHIANRSFTASVILATTAVVNILLNLFFIPLAGMHGAAIATILSAVVMNIVYYWAGRKYYDLGIGYWEGFKPLPFVAVFYAIYYFTSMGEFQLLNNILISSASCCGFLLIAYIFNVIPREFYGYLFRMVCSRLRRAINGE